MGLMRNFLRRARLLRTSGLSVSTDQLTEPNESEDQVQRQVKTGKRKLNHKHTVTFHDDVREEEVDSDVATYADMYVINQVGRKDSTVGLDLPGSKIKRSWRYYCCTVYGQVTWLVLCLLFVGIGVPFLITWKLPLMSPVEDVGVCSIKENNMFDCFPGIPNVTQLKCDMWNCCWKEGTNMIPSRCYHRFPSSYCLKRCVGAKENAGEYDSDLMMNRELCPAGGLGPLSFFNHTYSESHFQVFVQPISAHRVKIRVCDRDNTPCAMNLTETTVTKIDALFKVVNVTSGRNINIIIMRRNATDKPIFSINFRGSLIVTKNYTETTVVLPANCSIYGLGFNNHMGFQRNYSSPSWTLAANYTDFATSAPMYGAHPMYIGLDTNGFAHGVYFNNKHMMNVEVNPAPAIIFRTLGGMVEFDVVLGPTPLDVFSQLSEIEAIGKPAMPPYWALGFHMCQYGAKDPMKIIQDLHNAKIPFESDCIDADFWKLQNFDPNNKQIMKNYEKAKLLLKSQNRKFLAVVFPQVPIELSQQSKDIYNSGKEFEMFVKKADGDTIYRGSFFDAPVAYPDVYNPNLETWMERNLKFKDFDGFLVHWNMPVDMTDRNSTPCTNNSYNNPPYNPNGNVITQNTICMDSVYTDGKTHSEVHNSFSLQHLQTLSSVILKQASAKRPFFVSLGTSPGMGRLAGHWGGEYPATWDFMKTSLVGMFEASIYGIPLSGVPICGHTGPTSENLCLRWMQLGAFYPLSLLYYDSSDGDRHPLAFKKAFTTFTKSLLTTRYSLLPYLYTCFYHAHVTGAPVLRALAFEFPTSSKSRNMDTQFLWGPALMFVPCLEQRTSTTKAWLPPGRWYDYYTGDRYVSDEPYVVLPSPNFYVNLLARGGHVIMTRNPNDIRTAQDTLKQGLIAIVALDDDGRANGDMYLDDGESQEGPWAFVKFSVVDDTLMVTNEKNGTLGGVNSVVEVLKVFGVKRHVNKIVIDDKHIDNKYCSQENETLTIDYSFDVLQNSVSVKWFF